MKIYGKQLVNPGSKISGDKHFDVLLFLVDKESAL